VTNLLPGESTLVTFSAWTALTRGATLVRCTTAYSADQVPADDTLDGSVSVRVRDVGFVAIVSPPDTVDTGVAVTPQATVKNFGTTTEMFILGFNIPGGGYGQTVTCRLAPGNETTPSFPVWTPHTSGTVAIRCTVDLNGDQNPSNNLGTGKVTVWEPEGIAGAKAAQIPAKFSLESGRPNPFHGALVIRYGMPVTAPVRLAIYSTAGTLVRVLRSSDGNPGFHEVVWDGRDDRGEAAARGVYLYRLDAGRFTATREALKLD
jgi:hypothetical protein